MGTGEIPNFKIQNSTRGAVLSAAVVVEREWPMVWAEGRGQALPRGQAEWAARYAGTPVRSKQSPALSLGWRDSQSPGLSSTPHSDDPARMAAGASLPRKDGAPSLGKAGIFASQQSGGEAVEQEQLQRHVVAEQIGY